MPDFDLKDLSKEIPYKYRVQSVNKNFGVCVAYIDARDVMDLLDKVLGAENWASEYTEVSGGVYCTLSIYVNNKWISKTDCGTESNVEAKKGQASDALKRAAVQWGVGRFLYGLEMPKIWNTKFTHKDRQGKDKFKIIDDKGNNIYDVNKYLKQGNRVTVFNAIEELLACTEKKQLKPIFAAYPSFKDSVAFQNVYKEVHSKLNK